jgi:chemotaxis protein CheD
MSPRDWSAREVTLALGQTHVAPAPTIVKTRLGAAIAVCLYDPDCAVGGMTHFALAPNDDAEVDALEHLVARLLELGGVRQRLVAKIYGGAHVPDLDAAAARAAERTVTVARRFLATQGVPLLAEDVGGIKARQVQFHSATGRVFVRRTLHGGSTCRPRSTAPSHWSEVHASP